MLVADGMTKTSSQFQAMIETGDLTFLVSLM